MNISYEKWNGLSQSEVNLQSDSFVGNTSA